MLKKVLHCVDKISEYVGKGDSFILMIIIFATFYEVVVRYFLGSPTSWSNELSSIIFAIYMMMGGAYVYLKKGHVTMDILFARFSPRMKALVNILAFIIGAFFLIIMVWKGGERAIDTIITNEHSTTVWAPSMIPFRVCLPLGCLLFLLQALAQFIRDLFVLIKGEAYIDY
jgi:TRAP-type C4-dicarboxylate transport system permease small subunit